MRRRSCEIPACLILLASAAALSGCESRRDCVDANGIKLPDSSCSTAGHGGGGAHFVYGGRGGRSVGDEVTGGSTTRGGFGSSGEGEGGGHGGGEGGGE
jgi:hypothetical protein